MPYSPTLPAGSTLGKSFEYGVDVFDGTAAESLTALATDPRWLPIRRALNVVPAMTPITQPAQTYDDKGSPNDDVSAWSWVLALAAFVNRSATTGQPVPELKVIQDRYGDKIGENAKVGVRYYHKPADGSTPDPAEAFQGVATAAYTRNNAGPEGTNEQWGITLTGVGYATRIANPFTGWADDTDLPVIAGILPAGQTVGEQITISGQGFSGTTGVTIDTLPAEFTLVSDATIVAVIPATAAGAAPVVVTDANGPSVAVDYTVV
ncbi:phage tail tube protein [Promicromonospora vindobonensis]|uniref:Phage tail tube protein n=1 Tax=Promicromonospora vindobonensis TaxID=195748 RepID=A0ABW5VMT4_9MICO